ncbi:MAG TPA: acyl-ACP--UDP-N-acetylglucosamine O-acyltransferase [Candidatus Omnitrophota bacterium]|nr:acyl-ACP--UDP-N-acetylglucosamine O-acyltransferase [Candidatus Omnitrophota bacterium]HPD84300.1 acyl-ACP--UDP-N-acetylglucosamine O-acyltransferase [Candidatus Omnitrophota bacterium]HRZ03157.1 acyl-ACP--UDP-N-acetylglucosamine O-acyltransferase [Candidatus Omnitrophota bacterium]
MAIHKTAIISKKAEIASGVDIGPYSVIGDHVKISEGVKVGSFCVFESNTTIGKNCEFFTGAVIGSIPQDKKFDKTQKVFLKIGNDNIFREYVTVNPGTGENGTTTIGNNNLLMAYTHVAHDCCIGNDCTVANNGTFAGHVTIEDMAIVGGLTAVHQFARVGRMAIVGGCSRVVQDVPPYSMCVGYPAKVYSINAVGLKRAKMPSERMRLLRQAFKILFNAGLIRSNAVAKVREELGTSPELEYLLSFVENSKRGICHSAFSEEQETDSI